MTNYAENLKKIVSVIGKNKSIITMSYPEHNNLPRRIRGVANLISNVKMDSRKPLATSMTVPCKDLEGLTNSEEIKMHAWVALNLATQLGWVLLTDSEGVGIGDMIPSTITKLSINGKGETYIVWILLEDSITLRDILSN